jgi:AcrR family transcriptional regulator
MALDHDKRRQDIAEITIDLIAREGLEAATIRRIAAEAGFSTTAITHYFVDKQELLAWTFQVLSSEGERRFEEALRHNPADAIGALLTMVPWCPANIRRWKAYLAYWDGAARNPELASLLAQSTDAGMGYLRQLLSRCVPSHADLGKASQLLNAIIQGRAMQMLVDRSNWSNEKIRDALREAFEIVLRASETTAPL